MRTRGVQRLDLKNRYLDALALILGEAGEFIAKDRLVGELWRGAPVTDEALTRCIRTLCHQLGDDAAQPRFIETMPKHGCRFTAGAEWGGSTGIVPATLHFDFQPVLRTGGLTGLGGAWPDKRIRRPRYQIVK